VLTSESAADRTSASVTCPAKWFQLFHPIGGLAATVVCPEKGRQQSSTANKSVARPCITRIKEAPEMNYKGASKNTS
jgi:hypothetical protein